MAREHALSWHLNVRPETSPTQDPAALAKRSDEIETSRMNGRSESGGDRYERLVLSRPSS
jgi:hypothetical protein